ncbi:MAG: twin-arginine translocase TatA/TatE family subunit [Pyrinomonadaceae bacterium]|nr:twin-arginine translocase TatA/TatE family subunit [Sphingobacteriaceae bacterium]
MTISIIFSFLNLGTPEVMLIVFVALLLFGGKKLPELARGLGKGIREFKDASDGVKREIHRNINSVDDNMDVAVSPPAQLETTETAPLINETKTDSEVKS